MIAHITRAENPGLFEILKTYAESRGAAIYGDELAITGEWTEFEVMGHPHRIFNLGFRYRTQPEDAMVNINIVKNLTVIRSEGTP